jgi:hypothetical protein
MSKIQGTMDRIFSAIDANDIKAVSTLVDNELADLVLNDPESVKWIVTPANITKLHNALTEQFGIPRKMFMLRNRIPGQHRRAVMFVKAISNGLRRADVE